MTNVEALKSIYTKLGGSADDFANITLVSDAIAKIATIVDTAGIELPAVEAKDNGKVLTVVNGKWAAAALPD